MLLGCLLLLSTLLRSSFAYIQWVHVKGRLICGCYKADNSTCNTPLTQQDVRLMEYDYVGSDDQINATNTDGDGNFEVSGYHNEYWGHQFYLGVRIPCWRTGPGSFDECKKHVMTCQKKSCELAYAVPIPSAYYYEDGEQKRMYDLGNIELLNVKDTGYFGLEARKNVCHDM